MYLNKSIQNPYGISTFGSSAIRIEPDIASLRFNVSRLEKQPKDSFRKAREGAKAVTAYLDNAGVNELGSSRILLQQSFTISSGERRFIGYTAEVKFNLLLHELDRTEELLIGITDAGANVIESVDFQTSELKEHRAEARRRAVAAAREKAEVYCQAAGISLGPVIHIEDVNPNLPTGDFGHVQLKVETDEDVPLQAINPGSIIVRGAVTIAYELGRY